MAVEPTTIPGLLVVRFDGHTDERGSFRQTYQAGELEAALGRPLRLRQGNHARSVPGVLRGFHAEPWDKLVYVARGTAFAAVADIREDSATFGEVATFWLGDPPGERLRLFLTAGLANAYASVGAAEVDYLYDVSEEFSPHADKRSVAWDDPDLGVAWPLADPVLSDADRVNPLLRERFPDHPRWHAAGTRPRPWPPPSGAPDGAAG
jgi:dTDP-4-dehydrorhamnose 3,5-epimerase